MDISNRKQLILTKIVALHTDSGDPVGSHLLQEYLDTLSVSTATLRNEMAQLTAMGLLQQPHTSAGRIAGIMSSCAPALSISSLTTFSTLR